MEGVVDGHHSYCGVEPKPHCRCCYFEPYDTKPYYTSTYDDTFDNKSDEEPNRANSVAGFENRCETKYRFWVAIPFLSIFKKGATSKQ